MRPDRRDHLVLEKIDRPWWFGWTMEQEQCYWQEEWVPLESSGQYEPDHQ